MARARRRQAPRHGRRWLAAFLLILAGAVTVAVVVWPGVGGTTPRAVAGASGTAAGPTASPAAAAVRLGVTPVSLTASSIQSGAFTTHIGEPAFLRYIRDDAGHVSYEIGVLKVSPPARVPVYLVGGSNVREMIQTPADLQKAISAGCGVNTKVVDFGSTNQNFGETMAVVNNLPKGHGVVVIAVNHTRFSYTPAQATAQIQGTTLLMRSPALRDFIVALRGAAPADTIAPGLKTYKADWKRANAGVLAAGRTPHNVYLAHRYHQGYLWSDAKKRSRVQLWLNGRGAPGAEFDDRHGFNGKLLQAIADTAVARGFTVVLMEASADNVIIKHSFDRYRDVYVPVCTSIAAGVGGLYVDLNPSLGLVNTDFHDLTHLVESGRTKWTTGLAAALAPVVQAIASPSPTSSPSGSASASP